MVIYDENNIKSLVECTKLPNFKYILDYECLKSVSSDLHKSFFSGHSLHFMYSSAFVSI